MCSKHATRKPVAITRGGNGTRLRAVMPNGGVTLVTYDTRVTSRVCGRVIYVHSDNTEVMVDVPLVYTKMMETYSTPPSCTYNAFHNIRFELLMHYSAHVRVEACYHLRRLRSSYEESRQFTLNLPDTIIPDLSR